MVSTFAHVFWWFFTQLFWYIYTMRLAYDARLWVRSENGRAIFRMGGMWEELKHRTYQKNKSL